MLLKFVNTILLIFNYLFTNVVNETLSSLLWRLNTHTHERGQILAISVTNVMKASDYYSLAFIGGLTWSWNLQNQVNLAFYCIPSEDKNTTEIQINTTFLFYHNLTTNKTFMMYHVSCIHQNWEILCYELKQSKTNRKVRFPVWNLTTQLYLNYTTR